MKCRRLGSVFLLLMMIVLCLYGGRERMAERITPVTAGQASLVGMGQAAEPGQTEDETAERVISEKENADSSNKGKERLTQEESSEVTDISGGPSDSEESEYEYSVEEVECAQGQIAQVERFYYPDEHRAEYTVTSDGLNYTAKLQSRESEDSAYTHTFTMDIEIAQGEGKIKSQQIQWVCDGVGEVEAIYPDICDMHFQDANRDGYLDFMPTTVVTVRESWWTVFVWDRESEEYVKVTVEDSLFPDTVASYPKFYDGYMVQSTVVGFYEQRLERYRWEGNKLIFDDMIRTRSVDEDDNADPYTMTMVYNKEQDEFVPMDNEALRELCDDFRADKE